MTDICTVTFSHPARRNAITAAHLEALSEAVSADKDALLLTSADGHFSAGADLNAIRAGELSDGSFSEAGQGLLGCQQPVAAAIEGVCYGGGLGLALCADRLIATPDARFCIPAVKVGVLYPPVFLARLQARVPAGWLTDFLLTARVLDAQEALYAGLIDAISDNPDAEAAGWLETVCAHNVDAVLQHRRYFNQF